MNATRQAGRHRRPARLAALGAALAALVAAVALAAPAGAARSADPVTPEAAAAQMCAAAQSAMGPMFGTLVGSMADCQAKALAVVKDAVEKCKTAADNQACVNEAVQTGVMSLVSGGSGGVSGGVNAAMLEQALAQACSQLQGQMGAQRFAKEYGSLAGCKTKLKPEVEPIVTAAQAACAGKADPTACIAQQAASAEAALVAKLGGGPSGDAISTEIAAEVCSRLQAELGDRFAKKYGSLDGCLKQMAAKAAPIVTAATAKCKAAADKEACITEQVNAQTDALSTQLGAGPTAADIAEELADNACTRLKAELGARFTTRFKSDAGCRQQVAAAAEPFAAKALAACAKGSAACIQAQVAAGTEQLQGILGTGPTPAELAAQIADQACPQIMADNPEGFARTYGGLPVCRSRLAGQIPAADLKSAIERCKSASDMEACTQQAALDISTKLADQSGPSLDDIVFDAAGQTCVRLEDEMGREEYRNRFVSLRYCREAVDADVRKAAAPAWARCKSATDRRACMASAMREAVEKASASYTGPSSADIGDRLAVQACNQARKELGADEFAQQLRTQEACVVAIRAIARSSGAGVLNACAATPAAGRTACINGKLPAAAIEVEKALRAKAGVPKATIASVTSQYIEQICLQAKEQLGTLLDSQFKGVAGCRSLVAAEAERFVAFSLDFCEKGKDLACVRQQLDGYVPALQKRFFPIPADPNFYEINSTIAGYACGQGRIAAQKAGLAAVFDRKWPTPTKDTTTNCSRWFNGAAAEHAPTIIKTCSVKRPADVRRSCYAFEIERVSRSLQAAVELAVRTAAAAKR